METIEDIQKLPELEKDSIHIWGVHLPDLLDQFDVLHAMLSEKEQAKAARFHREADRQSSIAARGALRTLLSSYIGVSAKEIQFHYSENGKPHVSDSDIGFNVSHSADWVVLAFGRNRNIGVDIEQIKQEMDVEGVAHRFFAPEEVAFIERAADKHTAFFQLWARKEAYVKACGSTLFTELGKFSVPVGESVEKAGWIFRKLEAGSKYAAAVVTDQPLTYMPCYNFGGLKWDS